MIILPINSSILLERVHGFAKIGAFANRRYFGTASEASFGDVELPVMARTHDSRLLFEGFVVLLDLS